MKRLYFIMMTLVITTTYAQEWATIGSNINGQMDADEFGRSIDIDSSGHTIIVGAPYNDDMANDAGQVRVYEYIDETWSQIGLPINGKVTDNLFGHSVSISNDGNVIAIGAPSKTSEGNSFFEVYKRVGIFWSPVGETITADSLDSFDSHLGYTVNLSGDGNTVAVGTRNEAVFGVNKVRVYDVETDTLVQKGTDLLEGTSFGRFGESISLSIDGSRLAVGSPGYELGYGCVHNYSFSTGDWIELGPIIIGGEIGEESGTSIKLVNNGNTLAIGSPFYENLGRVRVFDLKTGDWVLRGNQITGNASGDRFGFRVDLSEDGNTLTASAPDHDGAGINSGQVITYQLQFGEWIQKGNTLNGENSGDVFGYSIGLNYNGDTLAVGAPFFGGTIVDTGFVQVYRCVASTVSILQEELDEKITLSPNPTNGAFQLTLSEARSNVEVTIYNLLHQVISNTKHENFQTGNYTIDGPDGIYFVRLASPGKETTTIKLIKN